MIICSPQLGISPDSGLGGEVYDREILKSLDDLGVELLIILPFGKKFPAFRHARIYYLPIPFVYPPWLFNLLILPYLAFLKWKHDFSVLRVHNPYFVGPAAVLFKNFFPDVKIVPSYLHLETENWLYDSIDRKLLPHYDLISTISRSSKKDIVNNYAVPLEHIVVVPCGVDEKYKPMEKKKSLLAKHHLEGKTTLLYLGQMVKRKNLSFLLELLTSLPERFTLLICGSGPEKSRLEKMAKTLNIQNRVIFTGTIPESEKVEHYNLADIFLYPSLKEGFGLSVAEALSCGKKVIASDIPAFREIRSSGIVLLPLKTVSWIKEILSEKKDPIKPLANYSWKEAARKYRQALTEIT